MTLVFATNNNNKVKEIRDAVGDNIEIISLAEAGISKDIPEPHDSLEANATEKSMTIFNITGKNCFSEDTGLEVEALYGEPGVKSARYAEGEPQYKNIVEKLLHKLEGVNNRKARFRTVISLVIEGREQQFEGICEGIIAQRQKGENGFGYDCVFIPNGSTKTFGEMTMAQKKVYSHRAKAVKALISYLRNKTG